MSRCSEYLLRVPVWIYIPSRIVLEEIFLNRQFPRRLPHLANVRLRVVFRRARLPYDKKNSFADREITEMTIYFIRYRDNAGYYRYLNLNLQ